jgi:hypothetical protein
METYQKIEQAINLKREVEQIGQALYTLLDTDYNLAPQADRIRVSQTHLPPFRNRINSGGARFQDGGHLRTLGFRQTNLATETTTEFTMRIVRGRISIIKRMARQGSRAFSKVTKAVFRPNGEVVQYQERVHGQTSA